MVYYNEIDPFAAAWLLALIEDGQIPAGYVDERSIWDVDPRDLDGFVQCHFFAGIGGWAYALRLAGWPDDRPIWTGSCPCQPFSAAGKGGGFADERHLWPAWEWLIRQCRPPVVMGEQVASPAGRAWFDLVSTDLEGLGYACGAADLCAASVGAPHVRQRLWFVAESGGERREGERLRLQSGGSRHAGTEAGRGSEADGVGDSGRARLQERIGERGVQQDSLGPRTRQAAVGGGNASPSPWSNLVWLPCRDGKWRPTQPGLFPLAHGVSARVGRLRGYGNAIVPHVAAEMMRAYMDVRGIAAADPADTDEAA